jgi:hypothetical protein
LATAVLAILLLPASCPPRQPAIAMTQKDGFVFVLVRGGWLILELLALTDALLAWAGIRVGRRRAASAEVGA